MDEGLQKLPRGWVWTRLGEIRLDRSQAIMPNKMPAEMFELYSVPSFDIAKPEIIFGKAIGSNKQVVDEGTVLLCKINPRINRVWIVGSHSSHPKIASTEWIPFFGQEGISPKYLCYFMRNSNFRDFLAMNVSGVGGSLMRIKANTLAHYPFPLPPLPEQLRILAKIEELFTKLDAGIEALKKIKAQLKRYRQAVLKYAFEGKLTQEWRGENKGKIEPVSVLLEKIKEEQKKDTKVKFKELPPVDTSELPELPEGWEWTRLGEVSDAVGGYAFKSSDFKEIGNYQVIKIGNVKMGFFRLDEKPSFLDDVDSQIVKKYALHYGDLIITLTGTRKKRDYGFVAMIKAENNLLLNQRLAVVRFLKPLYPEYFQYALRSEHFQNNFFKHETGNVGQGNVSMNAIVTETISVPPVLEQHKIVEEIESRLSIADKTEKVAGQSLKQSERLRQSILKQAFEGRLVPQDPSDEPADVLLEHIRTEREKFKNTKKKKLQSRWD